MTLKTRTEGIVFKKKERMENDILYSIFTRDFGRLEILGKGIRKMGGKLKTQIDLFSLVEIEFVEGKEHKILTDAQGILTFENLRKNFLTLKIAFKICEILDLFLKAEQREDKLWEILLKTFQFQNKKWRTGKEYHLAFFWFFWKFIVTLGIYAPPLFCFNCQKELADGFFELEKKIFLCHNCGKKKGGIVLSKNIILNLKKFLHSDIIVVRELKPKEEEFQTLAKISKGCFEYLKENYVQMDFV